VSRIRRSWFLVIPVLWCGAIFACQRPDAIKARPEVPERLKWLVYDESDLTAFAIRGANVHAGRLPGRPDEPDPEGTDPVDLARKLDSPKEDYSPRFYLEYPTPTLIVFELGYLFQPNAEPLPPAVADSEQFGTAFFEPRNDEDLAIWTRLRIAVQLYVAIMAAGLVGLLLVLRKSDGPVWLAVLPGAVFFSLNRFDVLPTLAVALSLYALSRNRPGWAGSLLAIGVLLKLFPVLFVPIILRYLGLRKGLWFLAAFTAVCLAGFVASWVALDWESTVGPIRVQSSRVLRENNWSLYGYVLPLELAGWKLLHKLLVFGTVLAACITRPKDLDAVRRRSALALIVFVVIAVFWSPQWILWFLPLLVPLAKRTPVKVAAIVLDVVNYFSFPILFWNLLAIPDADGFNFTSMVMIYIRGATWLALAAVLIHDSLRKPDFVRAMAAFGPSFEKLRNQYLEACSGSGLPRGLKWLSAEPLGEPVFVTDRTTKEIVALVPLLVQFEPIPGSDMEDVPQAREPRPITAVMTFDGKKWTTAGRTIFNLSPTQVAAQERFSRGTGLWPVR